MSKADTNSTRLREQVLVLQEREQELTRSVNDMKKDLQLTIKSSEEESYKVFKEVKSLEDRVRELHVSLMEKTDECETTQELNRKLRREYQSTRQDAEAMLQVMSGLEKQLSEFTAREAEIEQLAKDSKLKVAEALNARDQVRQFNRFNL